MPSRDHLAAGSRRHSGSTYQTSNMTRACRSGLYDLSYLESPPSKDREELIEMQGALENALQQVSDVTWVSEVQFDRVIKTPDNTCTYHFMIPANILVVIYFMLNKPFLSPESWALVNHVWSNMSDTPLHRGCDLCASLVGHKTGQVATKEAERLPWSFKGGAPDVQTSTWMSWSPWSF